MIPIVYWEERFARIPSDGFAFDVGALKVWGYLIKFLSDIVVKIKFVRHVFDFLNDQVKSSIDHFNWYET